MSAKDNATLVKNHYDAFNSHTSDPAWFDKIAANVADEFQSINPRGFTRPGVEGLNNHIGAWIRAFPQASVEVINVFSTKDQAVVEFIGHGVQDGPLPGPSGDIAATGKQVDVRFCEVFRFKKGKIVSIHTYYDALDLMRQLGVVS